MEVFLSSFWYYMVVFCRLWHVKRFSFSDLKRKFKNFFLKKKARTEYKVAPIAFGSVLARIQDAETKLCTA